MAKVHSPRGLDAALEALRGATDATRVLPKDRKAEGVKREHGNVTLSLR